MAMPGSNQSYYRSIDKDHVAAVAPVAVTVVTAPKNDEGKPLPDGSG